MKLIEEKVTLNYLKCNDRYNKLELEFVNFVHDEDPWKVFGYCSVLFLGKIALYHTSGLICNQFHWILGINGSLSCEFQDMGAWQQQKCEFYTLFGISKLDG